MSQEKFWVLLSKKLAGEASDKELLELQSLIVEHPEWQYAIQNLEDLWKHQQPNDFMHEEDAYMLHLHRINEMNIPFGETLAEDSTVSIKTNSGKRWYWAAAAVLLLVISLFLFRKPSTNNEEKGQLVSNFNEVSTQLGSKSKVQLPDGSIVWLNAGSKLTYTKDFGKEIREVTLTGEAFFDETKMKEKPFIIHTSSINIKVLGTAFNVKAYPEDKETETSLIRGSIEVTIKNRPNDKIILSPSEKLVVENNIVEQAAKTAATIKGTSENQPNQPVISPMVSINKLKYSPVDSTVAETQWINNKLIFRDEPFTDLAVRMERWYDVTIVISDPSLSQARLNGIFHTETISQALDALKESIPFRYEQTGNKIFIHR
jgi:transmembrane sensor